jgi:hypothetical protein
VHAVRKYLDSRAEPEAKLAEHIDGGYERCLVVPACREQVTLLDGYLRAAATSRGRTLCILVVNGRENAPPEHHTANRALLDSLRTTLQGASSWGGGSWLGATRESALDMLVVDRASEGLRFPAEGGVGLARKLGMDLALSLHVAGKVRAEFVFCTDADVSLPDAHFERTELTSRIGAAVFPFWHYPAPDAAVTRATALYELSLRYYVAGLAFAKSPYAFHSLGSAMTVNATAYAAVRGTPRREAGEDFYLLGKVAKVLPLLRVRGPALRVQSRASDRTPFGTGAGVRLGLERRDRDFYAPEVFMALAGWLRALEAVALDGSVERLHARRAGLRVDEWGALSASLLGPRGRASFEAAVRDAPSCAARRSRIHEWFDAFRTLKFVHALRDRVWPSVPWQEAVARAPFAPPCTVGGTDAELDALRTAFAEMEAGTPALFGPRVAPA